ncbi:uncharacterized protein cubi_03452 [Cryptosporidium ubiquitum]|uniref:GPI ethanolamine phosphate transferase 3 n=1 Tax=Cryptosporidium ubiquitum TaxID=857276 RepID=A0A1J4MHE7_9CRYT|nr:uncharacterized protein cubi_03452 [Cryptosporidium ubiquitum]OII73654.1 hypothetical protein cubi_03452 [Cryptosporidium ubiquitum]
MFRQVLIVTYLIVFFLGGGLFFIGFNGERKSFEQGNSYKDVKLLEIEFFKIEPIYDKVLYFIVDALRVDYLNIETKSPRNYIHNKLENLNALMRNVELSKHLRFYNYKADFPTLTTFRVKSMMSGENPGLMELLSVLRPKSNVDSSTILRNLYTHNMKSVVLGDDTWSLLYDQLIHYEYKYESLNIRNFDNLDDYVEEKSHLFLDSNNSDYKKYNDWRFMVMHFIGVDHIGHYIGINNQFMSNKLSQMDQLAKQTLQMLLKIDDEKNLTPAEFSQKVQKFSENLLKTNHTDYTKHEKILFLFFGDHGQNESGGHGGPCITETSAGLFAFSTIPFIEPMEKIPKWDLGMDNEKRPESLTFTERIKEIKVLNQIDMVPFVSSVLGIPIPENNLGIFNSDLKVNLTGTEYNHNNHVYSDQNGFQEYLQEMTYAKIMHNNALQMFNRLLKVIESTQRLEDDIKSKYYEFGNSYNFIKDLDERLRKNKEEIIFDSEFEKQSNYTSELKMFKNHYKVSREFASLIQRKLFKDRSKFDWVSITQGFMIMIALLVFVSVIIIPTFNLSMSKFMFNNKKGFLSLSTESPSNYSKNTLPINLRPGPLFTFYLIIILITSTINLIGLYLSNQKLMIPEIVMSRINTFTSVLITLIMMHILLRFRYEIKSFYSNMFTFNLSSKELRWNVYWCIMTLLFLLQFGSYSASFAENEGKVVKLLMVSYQIIILFSGSKNNLKKIILPLIQLILIRFTFIFEKDNHEILDGFTGIGLLLTSNTTRLLIFMIYLFLLLLVYKNILNKWNMFLICIAPIYIWFNWVNNNNIIRLIGLINLIYIINSSLIKRIKRYRIRSKESSNMIMVNSKLVINRWISNHLILIFLLKNDLIIPYAITSIIQLISIESLRSDGETKKDIMPAKGNKLKLDSIPEYVGLLGLNEFYPEISYLMVLYFLTSHLFSLSALLKLPSLGFRYPRIMVMGILLSKFLFAALGIIILRENIMVWQILSPKLIYEFVFCVSFSIYSLLM